jgi:polysaccharide pyruvyl transferase WcaK-like protein
MDTYKNLKTFHFSEEIMKRHTKKRLKCLIFGNFGAMNYGDEAILAGEIQELRKIPNVAITVGARFPSTVKKLHGVNAISLYNFVAIIKEISKSDFVIVGGGGLINKAERGLFGLLYQLYMLSLFFFTPLLFGKKLYVFGIGIYSNANKFIMFVTNLLLRRAQIITVRDHHSYDFLKSQNLPVKLYKDNSFLMDLPEQSESDLYFKEHYNKERVNVGISLLKPDTKIETDYLLDELSQFIVKNRTVSDFWFYSSDYNPSYFNDEEFGRLLHEKVGKNVKFHFVPTDWHPQKFFSTFKLMNYFIAMRLHVAIFAYRSGVHFVGIASNTKSNSFLQAIGTKPVRVMDVRWEELQRNLP